MDDNKENTADKKMDKDKADTSGNDSDKALHPTDDEAEPDPETVETESETGPSAPEKSDSEDGHRSSPENPEEKSPNADADHSEDPSAPEAGLDENSEEDTDDVEGEEDDSVELREVHEKPKSRIKVAIAIGLILVLISGGLYWVWSKWQSPQPPQTHLKSDQVETAKTPETQKVSASVTKVEPDLNSPSAKLKSKIEAIENLRDELLIKQGEIAELKRHYNKAIIQVADKILQIRDSRGIGSVQQALKDRAIELNLQTIQRRQAYIESLDHPTRWLDSGSEELLYLKRKINLNLRLDQITSGIDLQRLLAECDQIIAQRRRSLNNLALDTENAKRQPLESIWNEIIQNEKQYALNKIIPNQDNRLQLDQGNYRHKQNRVIWEEICAGDFTRRNELTLLSAEAAKCLAKASDGDLFLNRILDLDPEAAKQLIQWKGNWICLNGIKDLPPEVAKHLSQWKGNWLSLNGLSELSFESSHYLRQWEGKQLELMGLDLSQMQVRPRVLALLSQWEKSGGKLYISEKLRQEIKKLETL